MGFKTKILLQLLLPILISIVFLFLLNMVGTKEVTELNDTVEVKKNSGLSFSTIKGMITGYLTYLIPHFFAIILSNPIKSKKITLPLLTITNSFLVLFYTIIVYLKYLHYRDLSLLWIFYIPASMIVILISWFVLKEYIKGNQEKEDKTNSFKE